MDWSFQLYSARNHQPWSDVLRTLGKLGYKQVEGFGGVYDDPRAFRAELDKNGLAMPTAHFPIDMLEDDFAKADAIARAFDVKLMVCPYLNEPDRPKDGEGWKAFGRRLSAVGNVAKDAGYDFAWHNHDFEFRKLDDGSLPLDHIMTAAPDIGLEFDVAWCLRGGDVPGPVIERYGSRIMAVHVKDIAKAGEGADEDGWADVGHGTVDWKGLVADLRKRTKAQYFIMEHDKPGDFERFARRSIEAAKGY